MTGVAASNEADDSLLDPVGWASRFWVAQRIQGDGAGFLALTSLLRFERLMLDAVKAELEQHSLNMTDYLLLMTLQLSDSGTRLISSLARSLLVHATTATLATDRLEARGLLFRSAHPTDRRATCVTISQAGRAAIEAATHSLTGVEFGMPGSSAREVQTLMLELTTMRRAIGDA